MVLGHVCDIVGIAKCEFQSTPSELSPSNLYHFNIVCASLGTILPALDEIDEDLMPSPLLLLDEWMDLETSSIVH
jgi:hypothetical protein